MKNATFSFLLLSFSLISICCRASEPISLAGKWRFELDRQGIGVSEKWFTRDLASKINLPGSLPAQGIGDDITVSTKWTGDIVDKSWFTAPEYARYREAGNVKIPFWLQPEKYYAGVAWYQRQIEIPSRWKGKGIVLKLERPHWQTLVWLDDRALGTNSSLSTPHEYDLGTDIAPGKHKLTIRVDNGLVVDVGVNSHCISDHTQGNWNGIVGDISLSATDPVWVEQLEVYPDLAGKSIRVKGAIRNKTARSGTAELLLRVSRQDPTTKPVATRKQSLPISWTSQGGSFETTARVSEAAPWDEFRPVLFSLEAQISGTPDVTQTSFGFRQISTAGPQLLINGHKAFIRGTLECCIFPLTGHPPTDEKYWEHVIQTAKAHGLNLLRFHSYCPPEAAFRVADRLGFYYQVETCWANQSTTIGDGKPVDRWVYDETEAILQAYGNHPSFILMPYGNEPGGNKANDYLAKYVQHFKTRDPRRLWTSGSGWPQLPENQFHVTPDPRIQSWGSGLKSRINALPPETRTDYRDYISKRNVPVISHEIGEWCVYPNFDEIPKYKGYLKPKNFEIFRDSLNAHHMGDLAHNFLIASGKLQTLCYKEEIESALRTPGMAGFELLDLHDFPGQGTALVGVLDPFWDSKGYVTAQEFRRFCNCTVPLARLSKRVFTLDEPLEAEIEVAHFGPGPMPQASVTWRLEDNHKRTLSSGQLGIHDLPSGNGIKLGSLSTSLQNLHTPAQYKLIISIQPQATATLRSPKSSAPFENDWDIWVYPQQVKTAPPAEISVINELTDQSLAALKSGSKILLLVSPDRLKGDRLGKVGLGFSSIFWNTAWTGRQPPHTLGILCDPMHPAFDSFPTDYHSNWQWWYLINQAGAMILDDLPPTLRPTIQVIDDWVTNRKLGLLFEAKVGNGKLMVCSIDLKKNIDTNPVARQLLASMLNYMNGTKFQPALSVDETSLRSLTIQ